MARALPVHSSAFQAVRRFASIDSVARRKLRQLQTAINLADLAVPPPQRIGDIVAGKRSITADADLRLCRFLGLSNGYWLRAQAAYHTEVAQPALTNALKKIKPWRGNAA